MAKRKLQLHTKILIGLLLGLIVGIVASHMDLADPVHTYIEPFGKIFIRLITMIVTPLVFASLVVGAASLDDIRKIGRIGIKTLAYYFCTTAIAIVIGLILVNLFTPGEGLSEQVRQQLTQGTASTDSQTFDLEKIEQKTSFINLLLNMVPLNPFRALMEGNMLQIIFFALFLGVSLAMVPGEAAKKTIRFFDAINHAMIRMVHLIMNLAPIGVFALIASIVADSGLEILLSLLKYALVVIAGLTLHVLLTYSSVVAFLCKFKVGDFFRGIRQAQLIAFSTSTSSGTLPVTMECAEENLGISNEIVSFTLPLGATINMDGTALYQAVAAVFIAQVYGIDLTFSQQLAIILMATLASVGAAGVPGAGMITLAMVLKNLNVPIEGIALILGVDRILDMCRTVVNITGDATCALFISATEKNYTPNPLPK